MKEAEKASHTGAAYQNDSGGSHLYRLMTTASLSNSATSCWLRLKKYGKHLDRCDSWPRHAHDQRFFSEMICDCGFDEAKARGKA